ncbi:MAG TPA: DUF1015 family protein, partial [bacterium]|nr:DUF1015 family protein [bacterium]
FVEKLAAGIQPAPADFSYRDDTGTFFQLWRLPADPRLEAFFRGRRLYIADGHHRYQCNLRYGRAQRRPAAAYILTCFLNAAEVESQVNSFHRYLAAAGPDLLRRLAGRFHLQPAAGAPELLAGLKPGWLGFGFAGRFYRFRIPARPGPEVVYLHKKILAGLLDRSDESVAYEPDGLALAAGLDKPAGAAFFLPPVSIGRLHRIWEAGRILPRKSTYFYPKVPSGLIVYRNDLEHFNRG